MKYRKKPVIIDAERWYKTMISTDLFGVRVSGVLGVEINQKTDEAFIKTLEGNHIVSDGDWVITGVKGEKYACKPDIFELTYERA